MGDSYVELLVREKTTKETILKKVGLIIGMVICVIIFFIPSIIGMLGLFGLFGLAYLWKRWSMVEYEYIYCNGGIDIDIIMGMQSRKRILSVDVQGMEVLAPTGSPELRPYQDLKVYDYSSKSGKQTYEMVTKVKNKNARVVFEPNDEILQGMSNYAPKKVFL